ncbi:MAG: hypothetical protein DWQ09_14710 [Proteobacteria bacterium]|nr:MAG: hypothetical protein DWQ09_14710 [Pseudomonadota bacterium]
MRSLLIGLQPIGGKRSSGKPLRSPRHIASQTIAAAPTGIRLRWNLPYLPSVDSRWITASVSVTSWPINSVAD